MASRIKAFLKSERAMPVINVLFFLALGFRGSGLIFLAYGLWIPYLIYCVRRSESKAQRGIYIVFAALAALMLAVNAYSAIRAYMASYRFSVIH